MLGDPEVLLLDEPVNGLDPEGVLWIRNLMKQFAADGRTIFVSSHSMNEMAVTADHLIVIGRGKLITEASTEDVIARSTDKSVRVRTPDADRLAELVTAAGGKVVRGVLKADGAGLLTVTGLEAPRVGELAASASIVLHGADPPLASLEGAFMELTSGSVEFGVPGPDPVKAGEGRRPVTTTAPVTPTRGPEDPAAGRHAGFAGLLRAEWTKIRSVRSTVWTLVIFVVVCIGFTALIAWLTEIALVRPEGRVAGRQRPSSDPVGFILGTGVGPRAARHLRAGRAGHHQRVLDRGDPGLAAGRAAPADRCWSPRPWCSPCCCLLVAPEIVAFCSFFVGSAILHAHVPSVAERFGRHPRPSPRRGAVPSPCSDTARAGDRHDDPAHRRRHIPRHRHRVRATPSCPGCCPSSWGAHINAYLPEQAGDPDHSHP